MNDEKHKSQDEEDMDECANDVKREKREDPDDGEERSKDKESVAHGSPLLAC